MDPQRLSLEDRLRRAGSLAGELIEQVEALRARFEATRPVDGLPPSPEGEDLHGPPGLAPGEFRHAFSAAWRSARSRRTDRERILPTPGPSGPPS